MKGKSSNYGLLKAFLCTTLSPHHKQLKLKSTYKLLSTVLLVMLLSAILTLSACSNSKIAVVEDGYSGYGILDYWYVLDGNGKEIAVTDSNGEYIVSVKDLPDNCTAYAKAKLTYVSESGSVEVILDTRTGVIAPTECTRAGVFEYWYADNNGSETILSDNTGKFKPFSELPEGPVVTQIRAKTYTPYVILGEDGESVKVEGKVFYNELLKLTEAQLKAAAKAHYDISGFTATIGETAINLDSNGDYLNTATDGYWQIDSAQRVEFTPQYTPHEYTIVLDKGSTENDVSDMPERLTEKVSYSAQMLQLRVPKRVGYDFVGWLSVKGEQSVQVTDRAAAYLNDYGTLNGNYLYDGETVTLQPNWQKTKYLLRYFVDDVLLGDSFTLEYGVDLMPPTVMPQKDGYTFSGWYTKQEGGEKINIETGKMPPMDTIYYARFTPNENKLILNGNGGKTALGEGTSQQKITYATSALIKENPFTRIGYSFSGWEEKTSVKKYADMASYTMGAAAEYTLYAIWTPTVNTIKFDSNGGSGAMSQLQDVLTGVREVLPRNLYTHAMLTFIGWSYEPGVSQQKAFEEKDEIILTDEILSVYATGEKKDVITLYAMWGTLSTTITFDGNGNTCDTERYTQFLKQDDESLALLSNRYNRLGYNFSKWLRKSDSATFTNSAAYTFTTETEVTLYAQWEAKKYQVKLYEKDGDTEYQFKEFTYGSNNDLDVPVRKGYSFIGYYDNDNKQYCDYDGKSTVTWGIADNEQRLTARWTAKDNRLEFGANEGSGTMVPILLPTDGTYPLPSGAFTRANYDFVGWNTKADGTGVAFPGEAQFTMLADYFTFDDTEIVLANRVVTLYAQWINYTVTYMGGEGATGTAPTEGNHGTGVTFTLAENGANNFKKENYDFAGWSTDGGDTVLAAGSTYTMPTGAVTFTAQWTNYTVTYVGGEGATGTAPKEGNHVSGATFTIAANSADNFTKSNFDFVGWHDGTTIYVPGDTYTIGTANVTLTAQWINYTVTYVGGEGATGTAPTEGNHVSGATFTLRANTFAKTNSSFIGWSDGNVSYPAGDTYTMPKGNLTLTAVWYDGADFTPIWTASQLNDVRNNGSGKYVLATDINLGGAEWVPIGTIDGDGIFDGLGHTVSNFTITTGAKYVGLIGYSKGIIKNVGATGFTIDVSYDGGIFAGGLVGYLNNYGTITNCYATGSVTVTSTSTSDSVTAGGLIGNNHNGTITNCYATGDVSTTSINAFVGGLSGYQYSNSSSIVNCYATGNVTAISNSGIIYAGGLVGDSYYGTIINCYATGAVFTNPTSSEVYSGGLVGYTGGTITNSYATGAVTSTSTDAYVGGLIGYIGSGALVTNSYANGDVTVTSTNAFVSGLIGYIGADSIINNCYRASNQTIKLNGSADSGNNEGTATTLDNLRSEAFLTGTVGFGKYVSAEDLAANSANVWVFGSGVFPKLYYQQ